MREAPVATRPLVPRWWRMAARQQAAVLLQEAISISQALDEPCRAGAPMAPLRQWAPVARTRRSAAQAAQAVLVSLLVRQPLLTVVLAAAVVPPALRRACSA